MGSQSSLGRGTKKSPRLGLEASRQSAGGHRRRIVLIEIRRRGLDEENGANGQFPAGSVALAGERVQWHVDRVQKGKRRVEEVPKRAAQCTKGAEGRGGGKAEDERETTRVVSNATTTTTTATAEKRFSATATSARVHATDHFHAGVFRPIQFQRAFAFLP